MNFIKYFLKETWRKRTIYRLLFQWELSQRRELFLKDILDIGSGGNPSYGTYVYSFAKKVTKTDYVLKPGVDRVLDFNQRFPFDDNSFDTVIFSNALYIAEDPQFVLQEIYRILRPEGYIVMISPFVANEMPEPHDYVRFTREGLRKITKEFFDELEMVAIGERGSVAVYVLQPLCSIWLFRIFWYIMGLMIDRLIPRAVVKNHPFPLGYLYVGQKNTTA